MHAGLAYDSVVSYLISVDPKSDGIFLVDSLRIYRILVNTLYMYCFKIP